MNRFFGQFESAEDVMNQWSGADLTGAQVLAATYDNEDYSGTAAIIFRKDGKLFEAYCSHCSCNGLDEWSPEEVSEKALIERFDVAGNAQRSEYGEQFVLAVKHGLINEIIERELLS